MEVLMKKKGLWANIEAKRNRIASGSSERMRSPGSKGAPTDKALKQSARPVKMKRGGMATKGCGAMMAGKRKNFTVA
tara:strand:- start:657 stop:887 length:231 start_codon:yes stop_codon:yes gene_type:complete